MGGGIGCEAVKGGAVLRGTTVPSFLDMSVRSENLCDEI